VQETAPTSASEDFGVFGMAAKAPSVFWFIGGIDRTVYAKAKATGQLGSLPTNHSPKFAPVIHPTLETGVQALMVAAQAWLSA
jgi:metal-dependent amidase/aminoacylase/carboxypeptidase family protein